VWEEGKKRDVQRDWVPLCVICVWLEGGIVRGVFLATLLFISGSDPV
jgi:hypothetical protein